MKLKSMYSSSPVSEGLCESDRSVNVFSWVSRLVLFVLVLLTLCTGNAQALTATKVTLTTNVTSVNVGANVVVTATLTPSAATGTVTFKDGATNIGTATLASGKASLTTTFGTVGAHNLTAVYGGSSTYAGSTSASVSVTAKAIPTTVVASATSTTLSKGQAATLTATVSPAAATGSITFKDGTATLGTGSITAGKATLSLASGFSTTGTHSITAAYSGAATYGVSTSAALKITVNALTGTTTTLTVPSTTLGIGQAVSLSAKVAPIAATGTVTFKDGANVLGTGTLNAGVAVFNVSGGFTTAGVHGLVATYEGNSSYAASTSPVVNKTVSAASTSSVLSANPSSAAVNQSVSLKVTLTPSTATGTVTFKDGATTIGTAAVSAGTASLSQQFSTAGLHNISAVYGGDAMHSTSTAPVLSYSVTGAPGSIPPPPVALQPEQGYGYDSQGNLTQITRAPNSSGFAFNTTIAPDSLNRPSTVTDAAGGNTKFVYDGANNQDEVRDPRGLTTTYNKDGLGQVIQILSPDTLSTSLRYDQAGNLTTAVNARGIEAAHSYDALNRRTNTTFTKADPAPSQTQVFSWSYDQTGGMFSYGIGRLTTAAFPEGATSFAYDAQGRVTLRRQTIYPGTSANSTTVVHDTTYSYNASGQLIGVTYPSGRKLAIGYANGLPTSLSIAKDSQAAASPILTDLRFASFGQPQSWKWAMASGLLDHARHFDTTGRMIRYPLGDVLRDVGYDPAGRITSYKHYVMTSGAVAPAYDQVFSYDTLDRLVQATTAQAAWTYTYDANGNRKSVSINGGTPGVYEVSQTSNQLNSISSPPIQLGSDATGNITTDGNFTLAYDLRGRVASLTQGSAITTYAYDARGQRVRKARASSAGTTIFVYDLNGVLLGEYDAQGKAIREYVWLGEIPVAVFTPDPAQGTNAGAAEPLVYYVHTDHINTPRAVVDRNNYVRWRWMAEPFGTTLADESPSGLQTFTFNLRFPGQLYDEESGIHQNWHRDYIPGIGRYAQSDPIGLAGGPNTFGYVGADPLRYSDPRGLNPVTGAWAGAGAGSVFGLPGMVVGGIIGAGTGAWLGWNILGPMLNEADGDSDDPVVYPNNPDVAPDQFENIPRTPGKYCPADGSVWERDTSGHGNRDGEGSQWKRWSNKRDWSRGRTPNSIWPDGRIRK